MRIRFSMKTGLGLAMVSAFVLALPFMVTGAQAEEFGPVAAIKVDAKKAAVGKRLFFDKRLSGDASQSCATCHPGSGRSDALN